MHNRLPRTIKTLHRELGKKDFEILKIRCGNENEMLGHWAHAKPSQTFPNLNIRKTGCGFVHFYFFISLKNSKTATYCTHLAQKQNDK